MFTPDHQECSIQQPTTRAAGVRAPPHPMKCSSAPGTSRESEKTAQPPCAMGDRRQAPWRRCADGVGGAGRARLPSLQYAHALYKEQIMLALPALAAIFKNS